MSEQRQGGITAGIGAESGEEIDLYRFFAYFLGFPSPDRFERLSEAGLQEILAALWAGLGAEGEAPSVLMFKSYQQYEAAYIALFDVGIPEPPVPLLESHYHKAVPAQQTVLENTDFYRVLGLQPEASVAAPDHLLTQLEFLASVRYLQDNCGAEAERQSLSRLESDFLERHLLSWIPSVLAQLEELGPPVFPLFFALLFRFLCNRLEELRRPHL